jgi:hypothetical protein
VGSPSFFTTGTALDGLVKIPSVANITAKITLFGCNCNPLLGAYYITKTYKNKQPGKYNFNFYA